MDHVIKDDERRNQHRSLRILHDQVIPLKLPNLICVSLYAGERVAVEYKKETYMRQFLRLFPSNKDVMSICNVT